MLSFFCNKMRSLILSFVFILLLGCTPSLRESEPINKPFNEIFAAVKEVLEADYYKIIYVDEAKGIIETDWIVSRGITLETNKRTKVKVEISKIENNGYKVGIIALVEISPEEVEHWLSDERDNELEDRILYLLKLKFIELKLE